MQMGQILYTGIVLSRNKPCSGLLLHTKDIISANASIMSEKSDMGVLSISGEEFRRDRTTDLTSSLVTSLKENTQSTRHISKYILIYIYIYILFF